MPGATGSESFHKMNTSESEAALAQMSPLGRLGEPKDIADIVSFLVSEEGGWLTGQNIRAAGGLA
jgi:3-oxoacyl-[acyl-carrier protein] reductase